MKEMNPKFPQSRTADDYDRALRNKYSQFRKRLMSATSNLKENEDVVLMKNQKSVAVGKMIKLSNGEKLTIHGKPTNKVLTRWRLYRCMEVKIQHHC